MFWGQADCTFVKTNHAKDLMLEIPTETPRFYNPK
ncbi:hypothetical protein HNQ91_003613 [Filimonas zeae]|nr:hypothetical protein [Filimonas zeae]